MLRISVQQLMVRKASCLFGPNTNTHIEILYFYGHVIRRADDPVSLNEIAEAPKSYPKS